MLTPNKLLLWHIAFISAYFSPLYSHQHLGRRIRKIYQALVMPLPFIVSEPLKRRNFLKFAQLTLTQLPHFSINLCFLDIGLYPHLDSVLPLVPPLGPDSLGFIFLAWLQDAELFSLLACCELIKGSLVDMDLDACLTSVLSISKLLVRIWTGAKRIWIFSDAQLLPYFLRPLHLEDR